MKRRALRRLALAALCAAMLGAERPPDAGTVKDVRFWSHPDYTRVVVELDRPVETVVHRLPAGPDGKPGERLFFDLDGIWVGRTWSTGIDVGDGLLQRIRLGQNTRKRTRVVLDLDRFDRHRLLHLSSPDRLVLDIYGKRSQPEELRWPVPPQRGTESGRLSMHLRPVQTVVIDPGHGGQDPGAIGVRGIREKDVNLRLAHKLAEHLRERDFRVVLTRRDDRTLELEERMAIAESAGGDLFVSLHANASARSATRGIEVYYLNVNDPRHNLGVAARENGISRAEVDSLQRTLASFRVGEASQHSGRLAEDVRASVHAALARGRDGPPDLGVKTGPFYVLFLSTMPSILVESGFLTNERDAALLKKDAFLDDLAEGIAAGLIHYRRETAAQGERSEAS